MPVLPPAKNQVKKVAMPMPTNIARGLTLEDVRIEYDPTLGHEDYGWGDYVAPVTLEEVRIEYDPTLGDENGGWDDYVEPDDNGDGGWEPPEDFEAAIEELLSDEFYEQFDDPGYWDE